VRQGAHTLRLAELRREHGASFGGKSAALGELLAAGLPVPPGFALSTSAFRAFVAEAGLEGRIAAELARASSHDVASVDAASRAIGDSMRSAPVPRAVHGEIARRYAELADEAGVAEPPVAVRSSALGEDGEQASFAGQQETFLWVRGADRVCDAVRDCWASLYSAPAITYRAGLGQSADEAAMGVAVQLMVDAEASGVLFTCNPVSGDPSMVAVNASWGLGLAVVGGEVTPDDYLISKVTREVVREQVHAKDVEYVPSADGGTVRVAVPDERREAACLDRAALEALVDLGREVERCFGSHQDVEWALARGGELPARLFLLQSRPVTALPRREQAPAGDSALSLVMGMFGVPGREA
jgi:pyruvate,water dikinase